MKQFLSIISLFMLFLLLGCDANENDVPEDLTNEQNTNTKIIGVEDITINLNDDFNPLDGVTAHVEETDLTQDITVLGDVDSSVPGRYELTYQITDLNNTLIEKTRTVIVESESPVISIDQPKVTIVKGESFDLMSGVTVEDDYDIDLKAIIKDDDGFSTNKVGIYIVEYQATDMEGHTSTSTRTITVDAAGTVSK